VSYVTNISSDVNEPHKIVYLTQINNAIQRHAEIPFSVMGNPVLKIDAKIADYHYDPEGSV